MPVLLIAGLLVAIVGLVLFFAWFGAIWAIIKAAIPLALMAGGAVAAYLGWEEWRDSRAPVIDFSSPDEARRYKNEAKAYQAELNEMKDGEKPEPETAAAPEKTDPGENK